MKSKTIKSKIMRGEIYIANLDPIVGSEQGGERPVLVIQNDYGNRYSPTVVVLAITSRFNKKIHHPTHVLIESGWLSMDSIALAEHIRTIDRTRLSYYVGRVSKSCMDKINNAIKISVGVE